MRKDQFAVTVRVEYPGVGDLGIWDTMTGGEVDSEETKYRPGAMGAEQVLGGAQTTNNVTVGRNFQALRDGVVLPALREAAGKAPVTVTRQPLDADRNPYGQREVYTGRLKQVTPPEHDSTSSDPAMIELEISTAATVAS